VAGSQPIEIKETSKSFGIIRAMPNDYLLALLLVCTLVVGLIALLGNERLIPRLDLHRLLPTKHD